MKVICVGLTLNVVGMMQNNLAEVKVSGECLLFLSFGEEKLNIFFREG